MRVFSALCCDGDLLEWEWLPSKDLAILQDCRTIAEDEVDGAGYGAFTVELAEGMGVEGVLIAFHAAAIEGGLIGVDA